MAKKSKAEIVEGIKSVSKSLNKDVLTMREFFEKSDITYYDITHNFTGWSDACQAAGIQCDMSRDRISDEDLLSDWGQVVRKFGSVPTLTAYQLNGKFSRPAFNRFGSWKDVPNTFIEFANNSVDWEDVVEIVKQALSTPKKKKATSEKKTSKSGGAIHLHGKLGNRPWYGEPIDFRGLLHEPVNELGVVFLFGMVARDIGYRVEAVQGGFPDCEAKREVSSGKWQRVQIEFEFESKNFVVHNHDPEKCDVIICWIHNWPECPEGLEVLALSEIIKKL